MASTSSGSSATCSAERDCRSSSRDVPGLKRGGAVKRIGRPGVGRGPLQKITGCPISIYSGPPKVALLLGPACILLYHARPVQGEVLSGSCRIPKKLAVLLLPLHFRRHPVEDSAGLVSLVRLAAQLCEMQLILLNLHFEAIQRSLCIQQADLSVGHAKGPPIAMPVRMHWRMSKSLIKQRPWSIVPHPMPRSSRWRSS